LIADKEKIDEFESSKGGLVAKFKLSGSLTTSNMTLFDQEGKIVKFDTPLHIMEAFYNIRLEFYSKRKENLIRNLEAEKLMLSNKARFVDEVCSGELIVSNRKRQELLTELQERGYDLIAKDVKKKENDEMDSDEEDEVDDAPTIAELAKGYEYLLGMKIWSLTHEKAEQLRSQLAGKVQELDELIATPPTSIWLNDLAVIEAALDDRDEMAKIAAADEQRAKSKSQKRQIKVTKKKVAANNKSKKKKKDDWDSDIESDEESAGKAVFDIEDSDDDFMDAGAKPGNSRKRVAEKQVTKKPNSPIIKKSLGLPKDNVDEELLSQLTESLIVSPPTKKRASDASKNKVSNENESNSTLFSSSFDSDIVVANRDDKITINDAKASKPKTAKRTVAAKPKVKAPSKKTAEKMDGAFDENLDFEMDKPKPKKPAQKKPVRKKKVSLDSDDDSIDLEFDDAAPKIDLSDRPKRAGRVAKGKTAPVYSFSDDENEF
jgi:DNA topoisomerase-2